MAAASFFISASYHHATEAYAMNAANNEKPSLAGYFLKAFNLAAISFSQSPYASGWNQIARTIENASTSNTGERADKPMDIAINPNQ